MRSFSALVLIFAATSVSAANSNRHQSRAIDTPQSLLSTAATNLIPEVNAVNSDVFRLTSGQATDLVYASIQATLINIQNILHITAGKITDLTPATGPSAGDVQQSTQTLFGLGPIVNYLNGVTANLQAISAQFKTLTTPIDLYADNVTASFQELLKSVHLSTSTGVGAGLEGLSSLITSITASENALAALYGVAQAVPA